MSDDKFIRELIDVTKKMPLENMLKERLALAQECPWHENRLNNIQSKQVIYRIEPFDYFLSNVEKKQLYFRWPGIWKGKDIFDGAFVRTTVDFKQGNICAKQSYDRDYFCQCWSCEESENMWKLYSSPPYEKVMLISTVDKLMRGMWRDEFCGIFVGLVEYRPVENMRKEDFFQSEFKLSYDVFKNVGMPRTFLFKPSSLSYEKEVRFIARKEAEQGQQKERVHLMVDMPGEPHNYIDRILIDPRASEPFERRVREALQRYNLKVERSTKSKEAINNANVSEFYQSSKDNYGLPQKYSFSQ